jgi:hypothetical protein
VCLVVLRSDAMAYLDLLLLPSNDTLTKYALSGTNDYEFICPSRTCSPVQTKASLREPTWPYVCNI